MPNTANILSIGGFLRAHPATEGGRRFVYLQASDGAVDQQGELVLAKALADSADYFLRYGNLDLDHVTQVGPKQGIPNYAAFEIGRPVDVRVDGARTMVKGEIFQGEAPSAANANLFWSSITGQQPPQRWFPSIAGQMLEKETRYDEFDQISRTYVRRLRWTSIGFSKAPVNDAVPSVSTVPLGTLVKAWSPWRRAFELPVNAFDFPVPANVRSTCNHRELEPASARQCVRQGAPRLLVFLSRGSR